jgi:2-polyprenyl-3-methyl-5-hydroxy-6-metoxy-1,4-benzoquinol methylase
MAQWARRHGLNVRVTALDLVPEIAAIARQNARPYPEIDVRCADVFDLRARGETFDFVTASLFLHHVPSPRLVEILQLFDALANRGLLISDLIRTRPSLWAVTALSLLAGNHVVRHDAPLSVRRAFTVEELQDLAARAGLPYLRAGRAPWFHVTLAGEKS